MRRTDPGSGPGCVSSDGSVVPTSSFANHRLLWVSYPAFNRYYEDAKTASVHLSAFAFRSAPITPLAFSFLAATGEKRARGPGSWSCRCDPNPASCPRRQEALPASLETPSPLCPALRPRADLHALPIRRFGVAPARSNTKAPPFSFLRDSMTRLYGSLPTLEGSISGYQPRLASGGWSTLSERVCSRQVSIETFSYSLVLRSPFG